MLDAVVNAVFQERLQDQLHDRDVQQVIRAVEVNINLPSAVDVLDAQIRMSNLKQLRRFSFLLDSE
jgi:methylglyoxal synthase